MTIVQPAVTSSPTADVAGGGTFSFIVPAYNEAAVLEETVSRIAERLQSEPGSEVLIVENGSTDRTWPVAQELAARSWGRVIVRAMRSEQGLAQAYRAGAMEASGRYVVFTAADLPFGFTDIEAFLDLPSRPAFAIGSKAHPRSQIDRSVGRRLMSLGFRILRWSVVGPIAKDPQGSLIMSNELCRDLVPRTRGGGFIFGTEVAALAAMGGTGAVEVPVVLADERRSSTVRPVQDSWRMLRSLLALRRRLDAEADERARRLGTVSGPGAVLGRALHGRSRPVQAAMVAAAGMLGVALALAATWWIAWSVQTLALDWNDGQAGPRRLVPAALLTVAVLVAAASAVRRILLGRDGPPADRPAQEVEATAAATTAPAGSSAMASARRERVVLVAAASVAAVSSVVLALWRVLPDLADVGAGSGDARYWYWLGWRLAEQVRAGDLFPGGIDSVIWPMGYSLRAADGFLPAMVVTGWNLVVPDPTVAFNLATATAVATTALAGVRLARTLDAGPILAGLAGAALAVAPVLLVRVEGHYNLLFAFPAVLLVDVGLRHVLRRRQPFPVLRTAVLLTIAYLSTGYFLFYGGVALAAILVAGGLGARRLLDTGVRLLAAALVAVLALSPFLVPKLRLEQREAALGTVSQSADNESFASDATSLFTPPDGTWLSAGPVGRYNDRFGANLVEGTAFPGVLPLLGLGALLFLRSPVRRPLLFAGLSLWILSLGTTLTFAGERLPAGVRWLPGTLVLHLPGFAGMRTPNRASFVLAAVGVAAAVVVMAWLVRRSGRATAAVLLLAGVALVVASIRVPTNWTPDPSGPVARAMEEVSRLPDAGAVLHLPDDCLETIHHVELQVIHERPLVGCQGFTSAIAWRAELTPYTTAASWAALRCEPGRIGVLGAGFPADLEPTAAAVAALRAELGVGVVVFDTNNPCPERASAILDALLEGGDLLGGDDETLVIAVPVAGEERS